MHGFLLYMLIHGLAPVRESNLLKSSSRILVPVKRALPVRHSCQRKKPPSSKRVCTFSVSRAAFCVHTTECFFVTSTIHKPFNVRPVNWPTSAALLAPAQLINTVHQIIMLYKTYPQKVPSEHKIIVSQEEVKFPRTCALRDARASTLPQSTRWANQCDLRGCSGND